MSGADDIIHDAATDLGTVQSSGQSDADHGKSNDQPEFVGCKHT
jgi:hypothetical protein